MQTTFSSKWVSTLLSHNSFNRRNIADLAAKSSAIHGLQTILNMKTEEKRLRQRLHREEGNGGFLNSTNENEILNMQNAEDSMIMSNSVEIDKKSLQINALTGSPSGINSGSPGSVFDTVEIVVSSEVAPSLASTIIVSS